MSQVGLASSVNPRSRIHWLYDLIFPCLLFMALGGMTWAVRGCAGFGGSAGCIFAGVTWGIAWWFIAHDPAREPSRRYASAWIPLAVMVGVGLSGMRGWAQWANFFDGRLYTNWETQEFVPIDRIHGFIWLFLAGVPWAGIGACFLAWCGSIRDTRAIHWLIRIGCGIGGGALALGLFHWFPQWFLPLYDTLGERYQNSSRESDWNLRRLINDNRSAILHLGVYLGLLGYEIGRREGKNVVLILTVGLINGIGWSLLQNWKWAADVWPGAKFNWWRCWESSGGISIGLAFGLAYFLVNRPMGPNEQKRLRERRALSGPHFEWLAIYLGFCLLAAYFLIASAGTTWGGLYAGTLALFGVAYFLIHGRGFANQPAGPSTWLGDPHLERWALGIAVLFGLGFSFRNALDGVRIIYSSEGDFSRDDWARLHWEYFGPIFLGLLLLWVLWKLIWRTPRDFTGDLVPHAFALTGGVIVFQNVIAQMVTGPLRSINEASFSYYYILLFLLSMVLLHAFHERQRRNLQEMQSSPSLYPTVSTPPT